MNLSKFGINHSLFSFSYYYSYSHWRIEHENVTNNNNDKYTIKNEGMEKTGERWGVGEGGGKEGRNTLRMEFVFSTKNGLDSLFSSAAVFSTLR